MSTVTIGLVGNPNCGKTTIFNALTGAKQRVGNWPGVTVERKSGTFLVDNQTIQVVDLPGTYSLTMISQTGSIDEKIACDYILSREAEVIVNILDASNLERSLYLTLQLIEMQVPMILVVNMMDVARQRGLQLKLDELEKKLGCPVVALEAHRGKGMKALKQAVIQKIHAPAPLQYSYHPVLQTQIDKIKVVLSDNVTLPSQFFDPSQTFEPSQAFGPSQSFELPQASEPSQTSWLSQAPDFQRPAACPRDPATLLIQSRTGLDPADKPRDVGVETSEKKALSGTSLIKCRYFNSQWLAIRLLEQDFFVRQFVSQALPDLIPNYQQTIQQETGEDADILLADARYRYIATVLPIVLKQGPAKKSFTEYLDKIVLNRVLGIPIFLAVMYTMFLFAINVGGAFQDFFDISSSTLFVGGVEHLLTQWNAPHWLTAILADGVGKGINTTLTFIPVIGAMFLFLSFLEDSGYMARAAFVIDRIMRALGLPGKSFVPMIVGFGCNVPGVMAARTLENKRDRILTIMMSPFMSCGARLAIYAVFVAAFFPTGGQNIIFALYIIGILAAMLTGLLLRKTFLQGDPAPLLMELPAYHVPHIKSLFLHAWQRLKGFVFRAGKLIVPICMLLGVLNSITMNGALTTGDGDVNSLLSSLGRAATPIFTPMGIHQDNWPATVGLLTGVLAKEVVIGTLNALYSQLGHLADLQASGFDFWGGMHDAIVSIPANLSQLGGALGNPLLASAPMNDLSQGVYGIMYERFNGQLAAMAYLLFVLLYFPCVSTTAAMLRELHKGWVIFSVCWSTGLAYIVAVVFYQIATLLQHPFASVAWISGLGLILVTTVLTVHYLATTDQRRGYEFIGN